jgi:hypothetical protein
VYLWWTCGHRTQTVSVAAVIDLAAVAAADMTRKVLSGLIHEYERVA